MRASARHLLAWAILLAIGHASYAEYNVDDYCKIVKDGTKLASLDSCTTYYVCQKGTGTKQSCDANQAYHKDDQTCKAASQVNCNSNVDNPCAGSTEGVFVSKPGTCDGWIYCINGQESHSGSCGTLTFKNGQCTYDKCDVNSDDSTTVLKSPCDVIPNNFFFGDFQDCHVWYYCQDDTTIPNPRTGDCADGTVFSVSKEKCVYSSCVPSGVDNSVPGVDSGVTEKCDEKDILKSDKKKCSVYYICDGTQYVKKTCATGEFFDVRAAICRSRQSATPNENCDRCESSSKQFVNAVDGQCMEYLYCKDNVKSSKSACSDGSYFSEAAQACKVGTSGLPTYASSNGACIDATCAILSQSDCTNSCEWVAADKKCKPITTCSSVPLKEYCTTDIGCAWNNKKCTDSGSPSGTCADITEEAECTASELGCNWNDTACEDADTAPTPCDEILVEEDCLPTLDCEWEPTEGVCGALA